jgi:UDP-N-acetylmuramoyl-L-alanyl-D-glutamate--2,6-diaminopimelate ligase
MDFGVKNSKEVLPGYIFFSVKGKNTNGNCYIYDAVERGAKKIVIQEDNILDPAIVAYLERHRIPVEYVKDVYYAFAVCIKNYYAGVTDGITFLGITGTKGKTSTVHIIYDCLCQLGYSVAMMSSLGHKINSVSFENQLTTEMINDVYRFIGEAKKSGVTHIVLEVSAQAFSQFRILGIEFDGFIFNNLSQEHQETYPTQEEYLAAKCELYNYIKSDGYVILNYDDLKSRTSYDYSNFVKHNSNMSKKNFNIRYYRYMGNNFCTEHNNPFTALYYLLVDKMNYSQVKFFYNNEEFIFESWMTGLHYISNIISAIVLLYEVLRLSNEKMNALLKHIPLLPKLSGRNEQYIISHERVVIIDKAYTPNSVLSLFEYINNYYSYISVVFGCGGQKDVTRRPLIANIVEKYAQKIFVTVDNPRNENQSNIFFDISKGFSFTKDTYFIYDRKEAILKAIADAPKNSIILLLGKGDEKYQIIGNDKVYFSENDIIFPYLIK